VIRWNQWESDKDGRTQAVIEDPWFGIMSISRVWVVFIMIRAVTPTSGNVT
jgi:hypothetical protein